MLSACGKSLWWRTDNANRPTCANRNSNYEKEDNLRKMIYRKKLFFIKAFPRLRSRWLNHVGFVETNSSQPNISYLRRWFSGWHRYRCLSSANFKSGLRAEERRLSHTPFPHFEQSSPPSPNTAPTPSILAHRRICRPQTRIQASRRIIPRHSSLHSSLVSLSSPSSSSFSFSSIIARDPPSNPATPLPLPISVLQIYPHR